MVDINNGLDLSGSCWEGQIHIPPYEFPSHYYLKFPRMEKGDEKIGVVGSHHAYDRTGNVKITVRPSKDPYKYEFTLKEGDLVIRGYLEPTSTFIQGGVFIEKPSVIVPKFITASPHTFQIHRTDKQSGVQQHIQSLSSEFQRQYDKGMKEHQMGGARWCCF